MLLDRIPVRLRLSLGHAVWMALLFLGVGYGLYRVVEHNLYRSVDASLLISAQTIRDARFKRGFSSPLMERFLNEFFGEKYIRSYAQLVDLSGKISAKTDINVSLPVTPKALARAERGLETLETFPPRAGSGSPLRMVTLPVIKFGRFTGELIQVGAPLDSTYLTLREIAWVLWISLPLGLAASVVFGYLLTKRSLKPVTDISSTAATLGSDDLSLRLPLPNANDELRRLASTFNDMLDRLDDAFKRLRRFTGDVSHELRTPLAVLRGEAEFALRKERSAEDYRSSLRTIVQEANNMTTIIEELLLLARAESKAVAMSWMDCSTVEFVTDLVNVAQPVYDQKHVRLQVINRAGSRFLGNPGYLTLALKNILINAAKHSASGASVEFEIKQEAGGMIFAITDFGEGIPAESIPYIFDPFYRADTARNRAAGGTGIGLSLAMALVKLHNGTISVRSRQGEGASFTVKIPPPPVDKLPGAERRPAAVEPTPLPRVAARPTTVTV
jgi:heavy metal sensor kinase